MKRFFEFLKRLFGFGSVAKKITGGAAAAVIAAAVLFVGNEEGLRTKAYLDSTGVPTICYGETLGVRLGQTKTVSECKEMFGERLGEFYKGIHKCLKVEVPEKVDIAFLSLAYNIGIHGFCGSTVVKRANAGDLKGACDAILMWKNAGGRPILLPRRQRERKLCLEGL